MGKDCGCSKSESKTVSCEAVVEGTFRRKDGIVFTATMSATGAGSTCEKAKEAAKANAVKTLEHFLETYKPKIDDYTYKIKNDCDEKCDGAKYTLEARLPGVAEYTFGAGDMVTYRVTLWADDTKSAEFLTITGTFMQDGLLGIGLVKIHTTSTTIYDKTIKATLKAGAAAKRTVNLTLADDQINNAAKAGYAVAAQVGGNYQTGMAGGQIKSTGSVSLPMNIAFDTAPGDPGYICVEPQGKCYPTIYINELQYRLEGPALDKATVGEQIAVRVTLTAGGMMY